MVLPKPGAFLYRYRRHNAPSDEHQGHLPALCRHQLSKRGIRKPHLKDLGATDLELAVSGVYAYHTIALVTWFVTGNPEKHGTIGYGRAFFRAKK